MHYNSIAVNGHFQLQTLSAKVLQLPRDLWVNKAQQGNEKYIGPKQEYSQIP